jgi:hypothetical protein
MMHAPQSDPLGGAARVELDAVVERFAAVLGVELSNAFLGLVSALQATLFPVALLALGRAIPHLSSSKSEMAARTAHE